MRPRKNRCCHSSPKARKPSVPVQKNSLLLEGGSDFFIPFRSSTDWMRPTHLERETYSTQNTNLCVDLIQQHPYRSTENTVCLHVWAPCSIDELAHRVSHHAVLCLSHFCGCCHSLTCGCLTSVSPPWSHDRFLFSFFSVCLSYKDTCNCI